MDIGTIYTKQDHDCIFNDPTKDFITLSTHQVPKKTLKNLTATTKSTDSLRMRVQKLLCNCLFSKQRVSGPTFLIIAVAYITMLFRSMSLASGSQCSLANLLKMIRFSGLSMGAAGVKSTIHTISAFHQIRICIRQI